ncbi:MAG: hypothetical protein ACJA1C_001132 [Crocinitomicaceae bacterium]|jgi:hypothetical protein
MGIKIKEPCDEDWSKMTTTEQGAFCQKCAIDVMDYTNMTPIQIKSILSSQLSKPGRTCGKITNIQMDAINNDFYRWKTDQESFRAVWMVSLIAVFGMTLFSCQNTVSKEIVSQMEQNGNEILAQHAHAKEMVSQKLHTTSEDEVFAETIEIDSTTPSGIPWTEGIVSPWDWREGEITYAGGFGGGIDVIVWEPGEFQICEVLLGFTAISGDMYIPETFIPFLEETNQSPLFMEASHLPPTKKPRRTGPLPQPQPIIREDLNAIKRSGNSGFDAFVAPNPIKAESRIYLETFSSGTIEFTIKQRDSGKTIHRGSQYFIQAKHEVDLKLYALEIGAYHMVISLNEIDKNLYFEVVA